MGFSLCGSMDAFTASSLFLWRKTSFACYILRSSPCDGYRSFSVSSPPIATPTSVFCISYPCVSPQKHPSISHPPYSPLSSYRPALATFKTRKASAPYSRTLNLSSCAVVLLTYLLLGCGGCLWVGAVVDPVGDGFLDCVGGLWIGIGSEMGIPFRGLLLETIVDPVWNNLFGIIISALDKICTSIRPFSWRFKGILSRDKVPLTSIIGAARGAAATECINAMQRRSDAFIVPVACCLPVLQN
jgi:hypothetical protein